MTHEIRVPRLGWNMEEGIFHGWLKSEGAEVRAGEPLFTLEGDKSVQDVESLESGVLRVAPECPKAGDPVTVGALLGSLVSTTERNETTPPVNLEPTKSVAAVPAVTPTTTVATGLPRKMPDRRAITPRARRTARSLGVDPAQAQGTGRNGRIVERDVLALTPAPMATKGKLSPTRRAIAEHMRNSLQNTAPVTLTTKIDATHLVGLRSQFKAIGTAAPTYTDIVVKLSALALGQHPDLNARLPEDASTPSPSIHIGVAVDTEAGLLVPVLRDVPALSLRALAERSKELIQKARDRRLTPTEMQGGTFTVTNLGAFGIDAFTPIIHWPQCAILGLGRIRDEPTVHEGRVEARPALTLSLTFDHRLVDGAPAARFLQTLSRALENPAAWLVG